MRSKVFIAVGVLFALLSSSIATSADPITAPAGSGAGYMYTESELNAKDRAGLIDLLAGLPKQKLIELILKQQQSQNVGSNGSLAAVSNDDSTFKTHHTSKILLPLVGILAGGLAVATLSMSGHHGFVGSTNNNFGLLTASSRRSGVKEVMPFATAVATPTSTCNINIAFSCGPYPLHQTTCNSLAAVTTSESAFTPLLVKSAAAYVGPHILMLKSEKPPPGAIVDTSVTNPPVGYTAYTLGAAAGPTGSQITFGIVGLALHLLQVGASCTNGTAAVAGG